MINVKNFPNTSVGSIPVDYNKFIDEGRAEENIIPKLSLHIDTLSEFSSCIPTKKIQVEDLAIEYISEGVKTLHGKAEFWRTKFFNVTNSLTLIDCYFGTKNFKAKNLKDNCIFRNIRELNLSLNKIPDMEEFEEFLKITPDLTRIDFGEIRLSFDLLSTLLKYKNIQTIYCRGIQINLQNLSFDGNKLSINMLNDNDIDAIKNILDNNIEVDLKLSDHFKFKMEDIDKISMNVTSLHLDNLDISEEETLQVINKCPNLRELYINKCKNISNIDTLLQNKNLQVVIIDGEKIKEHIIIDVSKHSSTINKSIENYNEIDTLELRLKRKNIYKYYRMQ